MNNPDVARVIASYLDNDVLEKLYLSGAMPSLISTSSDQYFWHDRVETLSQRRIAFSSSIDWRDTYLILERELRKAILDPEYALGAQREEGLPQMNEPSFRNEEDNVMVLDILLSLGFKPDPLSIILAAREGRVNTLKFLLQEGSVDPGVTVPDDEGFPYPPLTEAAKNGHTEAVRLLLADPRVDPNSTEGDNTALIGACEGGHLGTVKLLLSDRRIDPTDISYAMKYIPNTREGQNIATLILSDTRVDPSAYDNIVIKYASSEGNDKIVALLLADPRVDPTSRDNYAIKHAATRGHDKVVRLLLSDPRVDPTDTLIKAIRYHHIKVIELLLQDPRVHPSKNELLEAGAVLGRSLQRR